MDRAEVHFTEEKNRRIDDREMCEVTLEGHGHDVRCKVAAADGFAGGRPGGGQAGAAAHPAEVPSAQAQADRGAPRRARGRPAGARAALDGAADDEDAEPSMADDAYVARDGSAIVKRKSFAIRPMSVDDAVLQLELLDHDFFFFTNAETGNCAVLYRRHDGGLGLIERA